MKQHLSMAALAIGLAGILAVSVFTADAQTAANTLEVIWKIDPWLNKGMNSDFERTTGCLHCHIC